VFLADRLAHDVMIAMRLMDDLVDLEIEKIDKILAKIFTGDEPEDVKRVELDLWEKIKYKAVNGRRTGLGHTGIGDLMAKLGIQYGTEAATNFATELQQLFASATYCSSIQLAEERGAFPEWDSVADSKSGFLNRMFSPKNFLMNDHYREKYLKTGRRNIGCLTIAPTGTVSLMTQTTSGIEPLFFPWYWRKRRTTDPEKSVVTDENGDMWEEYVVFHRGFVEWYWTVLKVGKENITYSETLDNLTTLSKDQLDLIFKKSPYYKATSQDVDYIEKVKMQGRVQKWVDHSISVTVNMPEDVTESVVSEVFEEAWKSGCKGITVYREGSRGNVLSTKKTVANVEDFDYIAAHKRPKEVECDVYFKKALGEEYVIFVGVVDGKPYEIFAAKYSKELGLPRSVSKGVVTKIKKQHYKFTDDKGHVVENVIDHMMETEQNQTRDYSAMLRHRINPKFIVDSIRSYATITSFQKGIANMLVNYIDDGYEKCPKCDGKIVMSDGCMKCVDCGHSACG